MYCILCVIGYFMGLKGWNMLFYLVLQTVTFPPPPISWSSPRFMWYIRDVTLQNTGVYCNSFVEATPILFSYMYLAVWAVCNCFCCVIWQTNLCMCLPALSVGRAYKVQIICSFNGCCGPVKSVTSVIR